MNCERCGTLIGFFNIIGSRLGLRVAGCPRCKISAPARMNDRDALEQWMIGHRVGPDGQRICPCCRPWEPAKRKKPGPGWRKVGPCFDHSSGLRVHLAGLARMPDGRVVSALAGPETSAAQKAIAEQGGNRRRGLMIWALSLSKKRLAS